MSTITLKNEALLEKYEISITGMTCSNCSNYLESCLRKIQQIKTANVNLILENALVVVENYNFSKIISTNEKLNKEKLKDNASFLQMVIEAFGFGLVNVNKIDEKSNKGKRNLNLVFEQRNGYGSNLNGDTRFEIKGTAGLRQENELQGMDNLTKRANRSSDFLNDNLVLKSDSIEKNEDDKINKTALLESEDVDVILSIPGVLNADLMNKAYYSVSYDSAIIKGSELLDRLNFIFSEAANGNEESQYKDINIIKSKNKYNITYTNEFKKNICEIYQFNPTTDFTKMMLCILLLATIFSYTFVCQTLDNFYTQIKVSNNIHFFLLPGFALNGTMIFFYGFKIYKKSLNAFLNSYLVNMDTLISLGSISAIFLTLLNFITLVNLDNTKSGSQADIIKGNTMTLHSAEAAAAVIAISVIGKYVEEKAKNNIKKLTVNMFSDDKIFFRNYITLVKPRNKEFSAYLSEKKADMGLLEKEDFCRVAAGDFLLFDCEIIKGKIEINENSDYGFNKIQKKTIGDKIKSGTQVVSVLEADCVVAVKQVVEESLLFKVIKEMNLSLNQKLKFQHFIDKIIKWFVPIIILISISTSLVWLIIKIYVASNSGFYPKEKFGYLTYSFILERAISILVVSCPCAFGLAIPTVTTIALNKALKSGILIKNLSILPEIRKANCFVFDKTGTLTAVKKEVKVEYLNDKSFSQQALLKGQTSANRGSCCGTTKEAIQIENLPIYEIMALIESEQKHPIAEILYSFAVKQVEQEKKQNQGSIGSNSENKQAMRRESAISLVNNSLKITSNGIEASIKIVQKSTAAAPTSSNNSNSVDKKFKEKTQEEERQETTLSILIGNATFIFKNKRINLDTQSDSITLKNLFSKLTSSASTNIFLCINSEIRAAFAIDASSIIRPEIHFVLESLRLQGKKTLILSGDNKKSVEDVAKKLSFANSDYYGEVNHTEKKEILQSLKNEDKNLVLMVGDGINDVLSLTEANYGISFNANSQLNLVAADIIFIKEDLSLILSLLKLSKLTYVFIWINIFWAFVYNIFMIPIASGVFYGYSEFMMSPTISSLSMLCSSLLIILTSNLLRCFDIDFKCDFKKFEGVSENNFGFYDEDNRSYAYQEFKEEEEAKKGSCCGSQLKLDQNSPLKNNYKNQFSFGNETALLGKNKQINLSAEEAFGEHLITNNYKLMKE